MMKKIYFSFALAFTMLQGIAQESNLNQYKYIIVPEKFEFLSDIDKYQVNSLTDFLFEKYGFNSIDRKDELPNDLRENACIALKTDIIDNSGLFVTKLQVILKNCHDKIVYTSKEGRSRSKDYKTAYHESLRDAFTSIEALNYNYDADAANESKNIIVAPVVVKETESVNNAEKVVEQNTTPPKANPVVVAPIAVSKEELQKDNKEEIHSEEASLIKSYKNENISFFIMEQNAKLIAIVNESKSNAYKKGEKIATLSKTSLPKVYRISWKNAQGKMVHTSGYFDDNGNLNVDIEDEGKISVKTYKLEN